MARVMIGIPCYDGVSAETLEDYMRFAYYCGRRIPEHDFVLAIKQKAEQFRARNAIVEGALQTGCDYLFFLDDDHVIDWEQVSGPNDRYGMLKTLIGYLEADEKMGICGALYYHRGAECRPVIMKLGNDGGYYWIRDDEIIGGLQPVDVQGGGCMVIKLSMLDKIPGPWFEPELQLGTDIQICKKAREAGFTVYCDTSIQIGHVMNSREVVTPQNRHRISTEKARQQSQTPEGMNPTWKLNSALALYRMDAEEYMGMPFQDMPSVACRYNTFDIEKHKDDMRGYYASRGNEQLARQVLFHHLDAVIKQSEIWFNMINTQAPGYGVDVGCGSAPVGFEIALRGHKMDFIDVDGAGAYEFVKWRAKKRGIGDRCGFTWGGPYDYAFLLDSLEHIDEWQDALEEIVFRLRDKGAIITNYFWNKDYLNPEHVNMDKQAVKDYLIGLGVYPVNEILWVKKDLSRVGEKEESGNERNQQANSIS